jgi:hypothetical protein
MSQSAGAGQGGVSVLATTAWIARRPFVEGVLYKNDALISSFSGHHRFQIVTFAQTAPFLIRASPVRSIAEAQQLLAASIIRRAQLPSIRL